MQIEAVSLGSGGEIQCPPKVSSFFLVAAEIKRENLQVIRRTKYDTNTVSL